MGERERFRVTLSPPEPLTEPEVFHPPARVDRKGVVRIDGLWDRPPAPIAEELFLRGLLDLATDDPDAVLAFIDEHGARDWDGKELTVAAADLERCRWLVLFWVSHLEGNDLTARDWARFAAVLNTGLAAIHARVMVQGPDGFLAADAPGLIGALCLQLWNYMQEGPDVLRYCANETCGRLFYRQLGRAEHHQNRTTGVLYCTKSCASAQASRESRRRKSKGAKR